MIPHPQLLQTTHPFPRDRHRRSIEFSAVSVSSHLGNRQPCNWIPAYALSSLLPAPHVLQQIKRSQRLSLPSSCQPPVDMREPEGTRWSSFELHQTPSTRGLAVTSQWIFIPTPFLILLFGMDQRAELRLISRAPHCIWTCSTKYYVRWAVGPRFLSLRWLVDFFF